MSDPTPALPPRDPRTAHLLPMDLPRVTLATLFLVGLIAAGFWVLRPFLGAAIWAATIVVATWPIMLGIQARAGGRRWIAVAVMTLGMLLLLIVPIVLAIVTIVDRADDMASWSATLAGMRIPQPPEWVGGVPFVGSKIADEWARLASATPEEIVSRATPYFKTVAGWFARRVGGFGLMLVHFLLTVVITAILYTHGETAAEGVRRFARRLAADRGDTAVVLAGQAVRAVALGVLVTAIVQTAGAGIGLLVTGIPYVAVLTAVMFMLCVAQIGPFLVLVPAVAWLYWKGDPVPGTVLLVITLVVGTIDNFLRPVLIRRGADLPLLLIFSGVIGGLIGFGVIGLFVGPVLLAVGYTLLSSWIADIDRDPDAVPPTAAPSEETPVG